MSSKEFRVADEIEQASHHIVDLPLCQLRLMDDSRFPWLLLVPRRAGVEEWSDLTLEDAEALASEIHMATRLLLRCALPYKVNIASLGNAVRQMHVHVVGRSQSDAAWPGTIWSAGPAHPYAPKDRLDFSSRTKNLLRNIDPDPKI